MMHISIYNCRVSRITVKTVAREKRTAKSAYTGFRRTEKNEHSHIYLEQRSQNWTKG